MDFWDVLWALNTAVTWNSDDNMAEANIAAEVLRVREWAEEEKQSRNMTFPSLAKRKNYT